MSTAAIPYNAFLASVFRRFLNLAILQLGMTTKMMLHRRPHLGMYSKGRYSGHNTSTLFAHYHIQRIYIG